LRAHFPGKLVTTISFINSLLKGVYIRPRGWGCNPLLRVGNRVRDCWSRRHKAKIVASGLGSGPIDLLEAVQPAWFKLTT
jgi:hypothetical protein